jgi:hypothetical protein
MDVKLNIVLLSHLSDVRYEVYDNPALVETRARFVRSLLFENEDTNIWISQEYLDWMWYQAEEKYNDTCSFEEWEKKRVEVYSGVSAQ